MGCLSDFSGNNGYYDYGKAGEDLPRRKILKTFKIPNTTTLLLWIKSKISIMLT